MSSHWYLVHSKPRQERVALENLERQLYPCYLPVMRLEKVRRGALAVTEEPLFTRYLFVQLDTGNQARSWAPIHSTRGVARLVRFGSEPARVSDELIAALREQEAQSVEVKPMFQPGQSVRITAGPFAGLEGIFQMADGQLRAMVLIEMLSRPVAVPVAPNALRAAG
jgi:transcriptional antiterminator RfaH